MSWASELPAELICRPTGLVVLTGLDVTYNAIHKAVWDCFCNNRRPDRVPLQFMVREADHEYPKCRSKRTSYEWYIPKGILKTSWMKKHLELVPSVVVIFFDLDWDEHLWKEKQMECASKVEVVRNTLQGRGTRVAVVLIQKNAPLPPGEDVIAAERAASLCTACDLSAKSLFVLPHTDHLLGYTIRLENAFYELAQSYYHTEARRVKAHKDFLNKTTHQLLFVRHQFKIAFFNELKQDTHTALKHYKQAYGHVLELRMHDTNILEIKVIARFINYKICRLSFQHNAPLDAIAQFRKHIDFFKGKAGPQEIAFEHGAWMSKQFQVFGDLFDEAIKLGLAAIQTQHPGFYYQQAANHAIARKHLCGNLCQVAGPVPVPDPLELINSLDYYGQRPWRQGHQSIDPPDALKERDGLFALQLSEQQVDHSWLIIPLLSSAVAQFKKYKSPRMKRYLMVQMGEEYYHAKDYTKALTLLSRVTWEYRLERWWLLLTSILSTSLRCAYLTANVQEYITIALELAGKFALCSIEEKSRVQTNLSRIMSGGIPEPEPGCDPTCVEQAKSLWVVECGQQEPSIITVEMHSIVPLVECKACFMKESFTADSHVIIKVFLRSSSVLPIRFSKLSVLLSNQTYNDGCQVQDSIGKVAVPENTSDPESALFLKPGEVKVHTFTFLPQNEDVGKSLEITSIAMELGSEGGRCAILHWPGGGGEAVAPPVSQQAYYKTLHYGPPSDDTDWAMIEVNQVTRIEPRISNFDISLDHEPPSLVNEFYLIKVTLRNGEDATINNVKFSVGLREGQDSSTEQSTHICLDKASYDGKCVPRSEIVNLGSFAPQKQIEKVVFMKNIQTGDRIVHAQISYDIKVPVGGSTIQCTCHREQSVVLPTIQPFDVSVKLTSLKFEKVEAVHAEEPFLLLTDISCTSPWPVTLINSVLTLSPHVQHTDSDHDSQIPGLILKTTDCASECYSLVAPPSIQSNVSMGTYTITWKRKQIESDVECAGEVVVPSVSTTLNLPTVAVEHIPLFVDTDLPAHGFVRTSLPLTYSIYNRTPYSQECEATMDGSDAFMFSGHKQVHFRILPHSKYQLTFALYPLIPGNVLLPRLHINMVRYPGTMDTIVQKMLPTHVYIKPSGKKQSFNTEQENIAVAN